MRSPSRYLLLLLLVGASTATRMAIAQAPPPAPPASPAAPPAPPAPSPPGPAAGPSPAPPEPATESPIDRNKDDWYKPTRSDPKAPLLPKPPPAPTPSFEPLALILDNHEFVSGPLSGSAGAIRADAAFFTPWVGGFLGMTFNGARFLGGIDVFRYAGAIRLGDVAGFDLRLLAPMLEVGGVMGGGFGGAIFSTFAPIGLRVTSCPSHVFADLRPTGTYWMGLKSDPEFGQALSVGVQLSGGWAWDITPKPETDRPKPKPKPVENNDEQDQEEDNGGDQSAPKAEPDDDQARIAPGQCRGAF